ncbi:thioesterase family protein [uncultured Corynebacterium sp.]|uniref:acyl-CoA thioesterase n=1 Tax=uncultured Corynebacterium sp. TaxID=159447 RepID=UPI0025FE2672|nr:thioesterase family protein [uncultured Corynebacterium sp.]
MPDIHSLTVSVRWSDFDRYGHMMNANYVELAQEARLEFARDHIFPDFPLFAAFVRHLDIDYVAPIKPEGVREVVVETWVTRVGNTSFTTRQEIKTPGGPVSCTVNCVQVAIDLDNGLPRQLTAGEKDIISRQLIED